jgi:hypothetical protein
MRIVFARALDEMRSALVIEILGQYQAGVAVIVRYEDGIRYGGIDRWETRLWFDWEWRISVNSPEEFAAARGWEKPPPPPSVIGETRLLGRD